MIKLQLYRHDKSNLALFTSFPFVSKIEVSFYLLVWQIIKLEWIIIDTFQLDSSGLEQTCLNPLYYGIGQAWGLNVRAQYHSTFVYFASSRNICSVGCFGVCFGPMLIKYLSNSILAKNLKKFWSVTWWSIRYLINFDVAWLTQHLVI